MTRRHANSTRLPAAPRQSLRRSRGAQAGAVKRTAAHPVETHGGHQGAASAGTSGGNPAPRVETGTGRVGRASAGTSGGNRKRQRARVVHTEPKGTRTVGY